MDYAITIKHDGNCIVAEAHGNGGGEVVRDGMSKIKTAADGHGCKAVLLVTDITPTRTMEAYHIPKMMHELGYTNEYRIAWIEKNPATASTAYFIETVLHNNGFVNIRLFADLHTARAWLAEAPDPADLEQHGTPL